MILWAMRNKNNVGYARLHRTTSGDLEIAYLHVDPDFRGKGIASSLIRRAQQIAEKEQTCLVAFIEPDGTGLTAEQEKKWLKRYGFRHERKYDLTNKRFYYISQAMRHKPRYRSVMIWEGEL